MFFISQNLKHVHMTYSVIELLIFFWLTLDIYCLKFQKPSSSEVYFSSQFFTEHLSLATFVLYIAKFLKTGVFIEHLQKQSFADIPQNKYS